MNLLELFAGSCALSNIAKEKGMRTFTTDIEPFPGIDHVCDILDFDVSVIPFKPDIIWASPPCTTFSVASIGHHWTGGKNAYIPKTEEAKKAIKIVEKTIEIIDCFPNALFFIENPRGLLRVMPSMKRFNRNTVTYCQYGEDRRKPTDIWTNCKSWHPKKVACKNGDGCHTPAPRGSRTGTQGIKGAYERSKLPAALCNEILEACMKPTPNQPSEPKGE